MMLIADAGSTKTDWVLLRNNGSHNFFTTPGLNPTHMPPGELVDLIQQELPNQVILETFVDRIVFYGAGCGNPKGIQRMEDALRAVFPYAEVEIYTDILGAARALRGSQKGIICILGTGAHAGFYDGEKLHARPSLGYLLGDEAGGASLGKAFLTMYLRGKLSPSLSQAFELETGLNYGLIMENLYMKPFPAKFMASLAPFVLNHRAHAEIRNLVDFELKVFFENNVVPLSKEYKCNQLSFTGTVACKMEDEIRQKAREQQLQVNSFVLAPIPLLVNYHVERV